MYVEKGQPSVSVHEPILVIDGQQRLIAVMLLLAALAKKLDSLDELQREPFDGFSPRKIRNWYLFDPEEEGDKHYKLIQSQSDKDSLISILNGAELPASKSLRITGNFQVFEDLLGDDHADLVAVCKGIAKLLIVDVSLSRDHDNPQLIFESMNSTGNELSQADLIRNFVLMGLEPKPWPDEPRKSFSSKFIIRLTWRPLILQLTATPHSLNTSDQLQFTRLPKTWEASRSITASRNELQHNP